MITNSYNVSSSGTYSSEGVTVTFSSFRRRGNYIEMNRNSDLSIPCSQNVRIQKIEVHYSRYYNPGFTLSSGGGSISNDNQNARYIWQSDNAPGSTSVVLKSSSKGRITKVVALIRE